MKTLSRGITFISLQILLLNVLSCVQCCNFGPGNLGFLNFGAGNIGIGNFGFGNGGIGNKGFLNGGALNTGFAQFGLRNIGALNVVPVPNTISVFNVPLAPNLTPPLPTGRRRRRSTLKYPEGGFVWRISKTEGMKHRNHEINNESERSKDLEVDP